MLHDDTYISCHDASSYDDTSYYDAYEASELELQPKEVIPRVSAFPVSQQRAYQQEQDLVPPNLPVQDMHSLADHHQKLKADGKFLHQQFAGIQNSLNMLLARLVPTPQHVYQQQTQQIAWPCLASFTEPTGGCPADALYSSTFAKPAGSQPAGATFIPTTDDKGSSPLFKQSPTSTQFSEQQQSPVQSRLADIQHQSLVQFGQASIQQQGPFQFG